MKPINLNNQFITNMSKLYQAMNKMHSEHLAKSFDVQLYTDRFENVPLYEHIYSLYQHQVARDLNLWYNKPEV